MTSGREEDALSWGDDDPTLDAGPGRPGVDASPGDAQPPGADSLGELEQPGVHPPAAQAPAAQGPAAPVLPAGWSAVGAGAQSVQSEADADTPDAQGMDTDHPDADTPDADDPNASSDDAAPAMGNAALISLGVFGGVFVLYAIGWYLGATRLAVVQLESGSGDLLGVPILANDLLYLFWVIMATLAAPIWFITTLVVTRGQRFWKRFVGLLGGVVLLVPWPFLMIGAM